MRCAAQRTFVSASTLGLCCKAVASSRMDDFVANETLCRPRALAHALKSRADGSTLASSACAPPTPGTLPVTTKLERRLWPGESRRGWPSRTCVYSSASLGCWAASTRRLSQIQQWRSIPAMPPNGVCCSPDADPAGAPGFVQAVKEALAQFWVAQSSAEPTDPHASGDRTHARARRGPLAPCARLQGGLERLRPDGARSLTASEWDAL